MRDPAYPNVIVRAYRLEDRQAVRTIACETAARGEPVEQFFHDREVFADLLTRYYTDWKPQMLWVAEHNGDVVGYLTGCLEDRHYSRIMAWRIVPSAIVKALCRGAVFHPSVWRLLAAAYQTQRLGGHRRHNMDGYPAHLHLNLHQAFRGQRIGERLVHQFLQQAVAARVSGVRAAVRSDNATARHFFERLGFVQLFQVPVVFPSGTQLEKRHTIVYGRRL